MVTNPQSIAQQYHNIRKKPKWLELIRWEGTATASAIYPNVYVSATTFASFHKAHPDPYAVSLLLHEEEHIRRIKERGVAQWYIRYMVDRSFRLSEELAAYRVQFAYLKERNLTFNFERVARALSGWLYLWAIDYEAALKQLQRAWDEV